MFYPTRWIGIQGNRKAMGARVVANFSGIRFGFASDSLFRRFARDFIFSFTSATSLRHFLGLVLTRRDERKSTGNAEYSARATAKSAARIVAERNSAARVLQKPQSGIPEVARNATFDVDPPTKGKDPRLIGRVARGRKTYRDIGNAANARG